MTEWSLEKRKLIIDHYLAGRSPEWIAGEMESTKGAIKMALSRWGVRRGPAASQEGPRASAARAIEAGGDDTKDLAGYLQALSGRQAGVDVEAPRSVSKEIARAYLDDPVRFIDDFAPFRLLPYQEAMVREVHARPYVALICSRQVGKSAVASYYATRKAPRSAGSRPTSSSWTRPPASRRTSTARSSR